MHEMGIADSILQAVRTEVARHTPARATKVGVHIGEMAGIDANSLSFCFDALVKGSDLEPLVLAIEPGTADELKFAWLELEEP
jgi:hydrogenase nickel incorporation protein HypA/HybF